MRKLLWLAFLALSLPAAAQTDAINGYCTLGGTSALVSGLSSTNKLQGIIPHCTVTVYLTGTTTKATIYKDALNTPLGNPFTANALTSPNSGAWLFYATDGIGYDIVMSGGDAPLTYPQPVTLTDVKIGGGGGGSPTIIEVNGTATGPVSPVNFVNSASVTWTLTGATISATAAGGGSGCSSGGIPTTGGIVTGDNTSTNCGYQNRTSDTVVPPGYVQTFGYTNGTANSGTDVVLMGDTNGKNNKATDLVAIGDGNANGTSLSVGLQGQHLIGIGTGTLGTSDFYGPMTASLADFIAIGNGAGSMFHSSTASDAIAIGDGAGADWIGSTNNIIGIGNGGASDHNGSDNVVGIGNGSATGSTPSGSPPAPTTNVSEVVGVGDGAAGKNNGSNVVAVGNAAAAYNAGNEAIAIGHSALFGTASLGHNTGTENIAVGHAALPANTTGSGNVALGGFAGGNGWVSASSIGNANQTGSNNTWIGYLSGPNTTTQLSNTIAIGYHAANDASNQIVLGNSSVTQFRVPAVKGVSGLSCLQVDTSGNITNTGSACGVGSGGSGTVTNFSALTANWPSWLAPTVTNSTTTPSLSVAASAIPNSALANSSITINSVACTLGGTCTISGGGSSAWSALTNPTGNLALSMGANTSSFTFGSSTGTTPWMQWVNSSGVGFGIAPDGTFRGVGTSSTHGMTVPAGTTPSPTASAAGIYTDPSGNMQVSEAGGAFSRVCTVGNGLCAGGGAALPAATAPGQFITSTGAGTAYAPQAQIFYSQAGDTLTSIEAECSSLCTYVVTVPQTFTLTANHTLSANVQLAFTADGKWTVNGAFTLTIPSPQVTGPLTTHFDGTATLSFTTLTELPFEWLGAVGDGTTDNQTVMQKCLNSLVVGQCVAQARTYAFSGTLAITKPQVGIRGTDPVSTVLLSTASATSDVLYVHGTGTGAGVINWNLFSNFFLQKSVAGTGTSTCMKVDHVNNAKIKLVNASNCAITFYMHDAGADYFDTTYAAPAAGTSNSAYWMDSTDGAGEQSVVLKDTSANCASGNKGYNISGTAINDIDLYAPAAGNCNYDLWVNYTGTGATDSQSDIHIIAPTFDSAQTSAVYISGITYSGQVASALVLEGGYLQCGSGTCKTLDIESSIGVVIANTQIGNFDTVNPTVEVNGSKSISLIGNSLMDVQANGIQFDSTSNSTITGNVIHGAGGTGHTLISLNSGSYNTVAGNTLNGAATNGIYSGDATNTCGANGVDPTSITSPYVGTCTGAKLGSTTVAGLPTATSVGAGAMYFVTDATATTGGTCTGGGTAKAIAVSDGSGYTCTPSGGTGGNIGLYAPLIGAAVPTAASTGFSTGVNQQGSFSITDTAMGLSMVDTAGHSGEWIEGAVKAYPGTTYTINGLFMTGAGAPIGGPANYHLAGFVIMNTTTSQLMFFGWRWAGGSCGTGSSNWQVTVMAFNSPTAFNATLSSPLYQCVLNPSTALTWLKLRDDGTNITFSMSLDGVTYQQVYTVAKSSSFLGSSGFNYIGMVIDPSNSVADGATLIGYGLTTP